MFRYAANVSALEFVPTSLGHLMVEVVVPACPRKKDSDSGEFVETFWCPVTGACEATCYSFLGMQNDWWVTDTTPDIPPSRDTEWGAEWSCKAKTLDFCTLEGMCSYPDSCPFSKSGVFGKLEFVLIV